MNYKERSVVMVIKKVNLDIVIGVTSAIPDTEYPEVAFAGKSNGHWTALCC